MFSPFYFILTNVVKLKFEFKKDLLCLCNDKSIYETFKKCCPLMVSNLSQCF